MVTRQPHELVVESDDVGIDHRLWRVHWLEVCGVFLLYLLLTLTATYPAVRFLGSHFIGDGDTLVNAWNLWWIRWAVSHGDVLPLHTNMLYHPDGVSLAYHTLDLLNGYLAVVLQTIGRMSLPAAFNTISLLTFIASGLSMFILVRSLAGSATAGLIASLIFTFSPYRMGRVYFGNLDLYSTQFIPLLVWFLTRMSRTLRWRDAVGAGVALSLTGWCSLELGFGTGILTVFLFAFDLYGAKQLAMRLKRWLLFGLLTCVLMSPFIFPMIYNYQSFQDQADQSGASVWNSADLLGFFIPDRSTTPLVKRLGSEFIAQAIDQVYAGFSGNSCEKTVFLGYSVLIMTAVSLFVARSSAVRQWLFVAASFFALCLGPVLHVAGQPVFSPMPYRLFFYLPLLKFGRSPSRLAIFLMLALAIVVGYGCAALERRWRRFRWIAVPIGVLIFLEFLVIPMRLDSRAAVIPAYYDQLAKEDEESAVLDVPIDLYGAQGPAANYMLYQTVHQQPIVGGYISRTPDKLLWLFERPFLYQLRARIYDDIKPYAFSSVMMSQGVDDLHSLDVQRVILHKDMLHDDAIHIVYTALATLLSDPEYENDTIVVWQIDMAADDAER